MATECDDFLWLIAQESSGIVGVKNSKSTARGLFQLLRAQYSLNPRMASGHLALPLKSARAAYAML